MPPSKWKCNLQLAGTQLSVHFLLPSVYVCPSTGLHAGVTSTVVGPVLSALMLKQKVSLQFGMFRGAGSSESSPSASSASFKSPGPGATFSSATSLGLFDAGSRSDPCSDLGGVVGTYPLSSSPKMFSPASCSPSSTSISTGKPPHSLWVLLIRVHDTDIVLISNTSLGIN